MNILNIDIKEDRQVLISQEASGNIYENNATVLRITIPNKYSSYYKYMDIVKANKEKTQTVISVRDEHILSYPLPDELTGARELTCQLVLKNGAEVFKSNLFILSFSGSINATQIIENKCADTIEYLMENKADKEELKELKDKKLDDSVFYSFRDTQDEINNLKADKEEVNNLLAGKVDKIKGKGLSANDFTNLLKVKLEEGVIDYLGEISDEDELKEITSYGIHTFTLKDYNATSYDETTLLKSGFLINDLNEYYKITGQNERTVCQYVFYPESRMLKCRTTEDETEWTEFEICGYISEEDFSADLKDKLLNMYSREEIDIIKSELDKRINLKADKEEVDAKMGDIEEALDNIIAIQNELIYGNIGSGGDIGIMPMEVGE